MCDTFTFFHKTVSQGSFFAKNSDRVPKEPQIMQFVKDAKADFQTDFLAEKLDRYTQKPLKRLMHVFDQFEHPYSAFLSRPLWIWGAEMGINEHGVAIGNEAVFSKEALNTDTGLLGMDILRLALHNASNADEAVKVITRLIEKYGQDGNGSYTGTLRYHNSFIIKDLEKAYILETSGKNWFLKKDIPFGSISNSYSLLDNYDESNYSQQINLKKKREAKLTTYFGMGDSRQEYTSTCIKNQDLELPDILNVLRSHMRTDNKVSSGMKSICVHPGTLIKSETTASLIVHYHPRQIISWHNSSPNPCVSIFKPALHVAPPELFSDLSKSSAYFYENRLLAELFLRKHELFESKIRDIRDAYELSFIERIYTNIESKNIQELQKDISWCYQQEKIYKKEIQKIID